MRFTGTLRSWNEERGYGFIAPDQGGRELFVHISALPRDGTYPTVGEKLSFEIGKSAEGKLQAKNVHREAFGKPESRRKQPSKPVARANYLGRFVRVVLIVTVAAYAYKHYMTPARPQLDELVSPAPAPAPAPASAHAHARPPAPARTPQVPQVPIEPSDKVTPTFRCDGRTYCSQMTSCAEAEFFLRNCPGTKMDGDHDGVPCEQQWCTGPGAK